MKFNMVLPVIFTVSLVACTGLATTPTALPTIVLGNTASTPVPTSLAGGGITASGIVVDDQEAHMAFNLAGNVKLVNISLGDQVQAGQTLIQLDDTTQQIKLDQADLALSELTSPEAIANARLAITTAQTDVTNAQLALNNLKYWQNTALVQNYYATMVLAKSNLDKAQTAYDNAKGGQYINNANQAAAYNTLYTAQAAYNNAKYYYSLYSQAPTQNQQDQAQANLDLANATLKNAQVYLAALTGGTIPPDASGIALLQLKQDQLAVQTAQANLDASKLTAPFDGTIMDINISSNQVVGPDTWAVAIADTSQWFVDTSDLNELDVVKVGLGHTVNITADALPGVKMSGVVEEIGNTPVNQGTDVLYTVHILLKNPDPRLRWGMTMEVTFTVK
jgi:multidrug efflux pump subunit AcrA (membrane-fusion protein)